MKHVMGHKKHKKPLPTAKNVRCRLKFAQCHQDWTIHDWYRLINIDETKMN